MSTAFVTHNIQFSKGAKMPRGDKNAIMAFRFLAPSPERQKNILYSLNQFHMLMNDISIGLTAEIEARQKQYVYYRDKLLAFKEKVA